MLHLEKVNGNNVWDILKCKRIGRSSTRIHHEMLVLLFEASQQIIIRFLVDQDTKKRAVPSAPSVFRCRFEVKRLENKAFY